MSRGIIRTLEKLIVEYRKVERWAEAVDSSKRIVSILRMDANVSAAAGNNNNSVDKEQQQQQREITNDGSALFSPSSSAVPSAFTDLSNNNISNPYNTDQQQQDQHHSQHSPLSAAGKLEMACALNNLGEICHSAGQIHDATSFLKSALNFLGDYANGGGGEDSRSNCDLEECKVLENLGTNLLERGEFGEAEVYLKVLVTRGMEKYATELGSMSVAVVDYYDLLSYALLLCKRYEESLEWCEKGTEVLVVATKYSVGGSASNDSGTSSSNSDSMDDTTRSKTPAKFRGPDLSSFDDMGTAVTDDELLVDGTNVMLAKRWEKSSLIKFCMGKIGEAEEGFLKARDLWLKDGRDELYDADVTRMVENAAVCCCAFRRTF
jgi:tetratricopeptide (TPR) repeat protein